MLLETVPGVGSGDRPEPAYPIPPEVSIRIKAPANKNLGEVELLTVLCPLYTVGKFLRVTRLDAVILSVVCRTYLSRPVTSRPSR